MRSEQRSTNFAIHVEPRLDSSAATALIGKDINVTVRLKAERNGTGVSLISFTAL
jgi:hypothetical protein